MKEGGATGVINNALIVSQNLIPGGYEMFPCYERNPAKIRRKSELETDRCLKTRGFRPTHSHLVVSTAWRFVLVWILIAPYHIQSIPEQSRARIPNGSWWQINIV